MPIPGFFRRSQKCVHKSPVNSLARVKNVLARVGAAGLCVHLTRQVLDFAGFGEKFRVSVDNYVDIYAASLAKP
ncbi:MAG: hypothetical protein EOO29_39365 [Comamonadaceae bacterium]|nr:MAG: hypothetical protein EOO29_39365 [Comamonadaceae bacterium]